MKCCFPPFAIAACIFPSFISSSLQAKPTVVAGKMDGPPAAKRPRLERWTKFQYSNPKIPTYVPPEMLLHDDGKALNALLLRAALEDVNRLQASGEEEVFYQRRRENYLPATYDRHGNRENTFSKMLEKRRLALVKEIIDKAKEQHTMNSGIEQGIAKGKREREHKIWLTEAQFESRAYGAVIGARGRTHQKLEKEYDCRIVVEGRGITDLKKRENLLAGSVAVARSQEPPHIRIVASDERKLKKCIEKINWILSDDIDAQIFREENRKALAIENGRYNPDTWVSSVVVPEAVASGQGTSNASAAATTAAIDAAVAELLAL
jgi:hypothetical protein